VKIVVVVDRNKCDLKEQRRVTWQEGMECAKSWDHPFLETRFAMHTTYMQNKRNTCYI